MLCKFVQFKPDSNFKPSSKKIKYDVCTKFNLHCATIQVARVWDWI